MTEATVTIISYPSAELPKDYLPLIFSRWLRSFRFGNKKIKLMNSDEYYKFYHEHIEMLMRKPDSIVRLAVLPANEDGPETVLGFSVSREDVLDYIHVQIDMRKKGIGTKLLPPGFKAATHTTACSRAIIASKEKYKDIICDPRI